MRWEMKTMTDNSTRIHPAGLLGPLGNLGSTDMNGLVSIDYAGDIPMVNGRELYMALQVRTPYEDWFPRMCRYGFIEGTDFRTFLSESTSGRPSIDHRLTINMAKELCLIQRSNIGRRVRQYFLQVEAARDSPEALMARALQFANDRLALLVHGGR